MSRQRILWVWYNPGAQGGVETFVLNMSREAIRAGAEVWIAATQDAGGPLQRELAATGATLLDWTEFTNAFMRKTPQDVARRRIAQDLSEIRPTLLMLNDCNAFSIGMAPLLSRVRTYCTIVDTFHIDAPDDQYLGYRTHFAHVLDGVVGTNRRILNRFRTASDKFAGIPAVYIPNGVPPCSQPRCRPGSVLKLLYVGRLAQDQKRILELPQLFKSLAARNRQFEATVVGDGPAREQLTRALHDADLADRVQLVGYRTQSEVEALLLSHDVLVNVSSFEGFSMSLLEGLAAGCVPTCTNVASIDHSYLRDGENCRLVPVDQPGALVDIWARLTPEEIGRMSNAARSTAGQLTSELCFERYMQFGSRLKALRPTPSWPAVPFGTELRWDLACNNPWIAHTPLWRKGLAALRRRLLPRVAS